MLAMIEKHKELFKEKEEKFHSFILFINRNLCKIKLRFFLLL